MYASYSKINEVKMKREIIMLCVRIPIELRDKIKKSAIEKKMSMMSWVINSIENELKRIEK